MRRGVYLCLLFSLVACLLLLGGGFVVWYPQHAPTATKAGTIVVAWTLADSDRADIRRAAQTDPQVLDKQYEVDIGFDRTARDPSMRLKIAVHVQHAAVAFEEDGKPVRIRAPVILLVKAVDANGFSLSSGTCMGPHYAFSDPRMHLTCTVGAKKNTFSLLYDGGFNVSADGEGQIEIR